MTAPPLQFRFAAPEDESAVLELVESAYRGDASRAGWTTEADLLGGQRTDLQAVRTIIFDVPLAYSGGALIGCCHLDARPPRDAYFGMFAVSPLGQGNGWGSAILAEAEQRAREDMKAERIVMTVIRQRLDLIAWYERRGYVRTGETMPFPYGDERYGIPKRDDLEFVVLAKQLG